MSGGRFVRGLPGIFLAMGLIVLILMVVKPGRAHANQQYPDYDCATAYNVPVSGLNGLDGFTQSGRANSASWNNGSYHYVMYFYAVAGPTILNERGGVIGQPTEINSWDCNGAGGGAAGQAKDNVAPPSWSGLSPVNAYLGAPAGCETSSKGCLPSSPHDGIYLANIGGAPATSTRPPVFTQPYGSAAAFVDDNGRAFITNSNNQDETVYCQSFTDPNQPLPDGDNPTCPNPPYKNDTNIQGNSNGIGDKDGAGYLQNAPDCLLGNPRTYNKGKELDGKIFQCDGTTGDAFSWYDQFPGGSFGTLATSSDLSGENAVSLSGIIGHNTSGNLNNFELHLSAVDTFPPGFGTGMFITYEYPLDLHSPTFTVEPAASCGSSDVTFTASDSDDPGAAMPGFYTINGKTTDFTTSTKGSYTIPMSTYDQLVVTGVSITVDSITASGSKGTQPPATALVNYGPCYTASCNPTTSLSADPGGAELLAGGPVSVTATLTLTPVLGSGAVPPPPAPIIGGTETVTAGSQTETQPGAATVIDLFTAPKDAGSFTMSLSFVDGSITVKCSQTFNTGYGPYIQVNGGDVVAGSEFAGSGSSCSNTNAGVIGWNPTGPTGAGSQFAVEAMGPVDGFASGQGSVAGVPSGLTFANSDTGLSESPGSDNFGGNFGTAPCANNYYVGSSTAKVKIRSSLDIGTLASGSYIYPGGLTIKASIIPLSASDTIYVSGNVYIAHNITYASYVGATTPAQIPQLTIVATGNIYIDPSVTELDGIYVAQPFGGTKPTIYDCAIGFKSNFPGFTSCDKQLTVYGAFVANQIDYMRTYGNLYPSSNTSGGTNPSGSGPAEVFNYSPELWLAGQSGTTINLPCKTSLNVACYDAITSLPPDL